MSATVIILLYSATVSPGKPMAAQGLIEQSLNAIPSSSRLWEIVSYFICRHKYKACIDSYSERNASLGNWIATRRARTKHKNGFHDFPLNSSMFANVCSFLLCVYG